MKFLPGNCKRFTLWTNYHILSLKTDFLLSVFVSFGIYVILKYLLFFGKAILPSRNFYTPSTLLPSWFLHCKGQETLESVMKNRGNTVTWPDVTDDLNVISQCAVDLLPSPWSLVAAYEAHGRCWSLLSLALKPWTIAARHALANFKAKKKAQVFAWTRKKVEKCTLFQEDQVLRGQHQLGICDIFFFILFFFFSSSKEETEEKTRGSTDSSDLTQFDSGW